MCVSWTQRGTRSLSFFSVPDPSHSRVRGRDSTSSGGYWPLPGSMVSPSLLRPSPSPTPPWQPPPAFLRTEKKAVVTPHLLATGHLLLKDSHKTLVRPEMSSLGARQLHGKGMAQILALPLGWGWGSSLKVSEPQFRTCKMGARPFTLEYFVRIRGLGGAQWEAYYSF